MVPNPKRSDNIPSFPKIEDLQIQEEVLTDDREWLFDDALSLIGIFSLLYATSKFIKY